MKKDLYDVGVEISSISAMVTGLSFQFEDGSARLNDEHFSLALHGLSEYLDRVADSIEEIDENYMLIERGNVYDIG